MPNFWETLENKIGWLPITVEYSPVEKPDYYKHLTYPGYYAVTKGARIHDYMRVHLLTLYSIKDSRFVEGSYVVEFKLHWAVIHRHDTRDLLVDTLFGINSDSTSPPFSATQLDETRLIMKPTIRDTSIWRLNTPVSREEVYKLRCAEFYAGPDRPIDYEMPDENNPFGWVIYLPNGVDITKFKKHNKQYTGVGGWKPFRFEHTVLSLFVDPFFKDKYNEKLFWKDYIKITCHFCEHGACMRPFWLFDHSDVLQKAYGCVICDSVYGEDGHLRRKCLHCDKWFRALVYSGVKGTGLNKEDWKLEVADVCVDCQTTPPPPPSPSVSSLDMDLALSGIEPLSKRSRLI